MAVLGVFLGLSSLTDQIFIKAQRELKVLRYE